MSKPTECAGDDEREPADSGAPRAESTTDTGGDADRGTTASDSDWTAHLRGRDYALATDSSWKGNRIVLRIDGHVVKEQVVHGERETISLGVGRSLTLRFGMAGALKRATVRDGDVDLDLDAPPGTKAARLQAWGRQHPRLYAIRHVLSSGLGILLGLIGINWLIRLIRPYLPEVSFPEIPWPDIPRPQISLPRIPWPRLDFLDITPPAWVVVLLDTSKYWMPLLVGVLVAIWEVRRQRRQRAYRERVASEPTREVDPSRPGAPEASRRGDVTAAPAEETDGEERGREGALEEDRGPRQLVDGQVRQRREGRRVDDGLG